jgi:hypothetical protein
MASTKDEAAKVANPVPNGGDHDRVVMLSLKADGTPDQHNPELIGDKDTALAAAKRQFAEQAVAGVDAVRRAELGLAGTSTSGGTADAQIDKLKAEHDKAAKAAESKAESVVNSLHQG